MDEGIPPRPQAARHRRPALGFPLGLLLGGVVLGTAAVWALAGIPGVPGGDVLALRSEVDRAVAAPAAAQINPRTANGAAAEARQAVAQVAEFAEHQGGIDQRVAAMEQRLARLDLQAQAAAGNASRAEGLLVAFAARRALERGMRLGYLEDQLRLRFGNAQPNAVQAVIDAARDPVTLEQLVARLGGLAPSLGQRPAREGIWGWVSREASQLFVVRHEGAPSPAPGNRLERARLFLHTGRADAAAAEVRQLPNAARAHDWIADADRYAGAQRALELLEATAILEPRELRDREGRPVEQPSPVA